MKSEQEIKEKIKEFERKEEAAENMIEHCWLNGGKSALQWVLNEIGDINNEKLKQL